MTVHVIDQTTFSYLVPNNIHERVIADHVIFELHYSCRRWLENNSISDMFI